MSSKQLQGKVVSTKMNKTGVVQVETPKIHARYGKRFIKFKKYKVHDPENKLVEGDTVVIVESRPLSKTKSWTIGEVVNSATKKA